MNDIAYAPYVLGALCCVLFNVALVVVFAAVVRSGQISQNEPD